MGETEDYDKSSTPLAHKTTHQDGGSDEISVQGLSGALADNQPSSWALVSGKPTTFAPEAHKTSHQDGGTDEISVEGLAGELTAEQKSSWAKVSGKPTTFTPTTHKTDHQDGGTDEISVQGLSGALADNQPSSWALVSGKPTTFAPEAHKTSHQDGGSDEISVAGLDGLLSADQHVLDSEVLAVAAAKTHGSLHLPNGSDPIGLPKFSAHKNGTNQTGIVDITFTKITFPTEEYDVGGGYDAANSKWVPGIIGHVHVDACIRWVVAVDQKLLAIRIYLNGVAYKGTSPQSSGTQGPSTNISVDIPITAITDYIEIYAIHNTGVNQDLLGTASTTFFTGHVLP